jgi:taurine dehydrogenase small subunit
MTTQTQDDVAIQMLAQRYGEAWNRQDLDAIMDMHTDDCVFTAFASGSPLAKGKEAVREAFAGYIAMMPDIHFAERSLQLGQDHWVLESTMSGTIEQAIEVDGEELGVRGAQIQVPCVDVIQVRDGLIASKHTYLDSITMQRQLGGGE